MIFILLFLGSPWTELSFRGDADAALRNYYESPFSMDGNEEITDKGDLVWMSCDVTQDGHDDLVVSGTNCLSGDWDWLAWKVYKGDGDGGYVRLRFGMCFSLDDVLVVTDEEGGRHLATIRHVSQEEQVVTALELEKDAGISSRAFRNLKSDSQEDIDWLQKQRSNASGLVHRIPKDEAEKKYPRKELSPDSEQQDDSEPGQESVVENAAAGQPSQATESGSVGDPVLGDKL